MKLSAGIGIGAAVLAVVAGGGYFYAQGVATERAQEMVEKIQAQLPPGASLEVEGLSASPFGSATVDGFVLRSPDGDLAAGESTFAGDDSRIDLVRMTDVRTLGDDALRIDSIKLGNFTHPDFARLGLTLQGKAGGYDDPVEALRGVGAEELEVTGITLNDGDFGGEIASVTLRDLVKGDVGTFAMNGMDFADDAESFVVDRFEIEDVELADAVAAALSGAEGEDIMAVTRHGAFELSGLEVMEDGKTLLSLERTALTDPEHVGDLLMAGKFVMEGLVFDVRDNMDIAELRTMREIMGPAADKPFEMSLVVASTYEDDVLTLTEMDFDVVDIGSIQMSAVLSGLTLDAAAVTDVSAPAQQEALMAAMFEATPDDVNLLVTHTGWLHDVIEREAGGAAAAQEQALAISAIVTMATAALVGQNDAGKLGQGVAALMTESEELTVTAKNTQGMAVREVMSSGGADIVALEVEYD